MNVLKSTLPSILIKEYRVYSKTSKMLRVHWYFVNELVHIVRTEIINFFLYSKIFIYEAPTKPCEMATLHKVTIGTKIS